jgi:hypothetical protein
VPRTCTVCVHPQRGEIEAALVRGVSAYEIEAVYTGLKKSSVQRHHDNHLSLSLRKAQELEDIADADKIKHELEGVKEDVHRLRNKAEEEGDIRTALAGCDRALKALELQAKLAQIISDAPNVNIIESPQYIQLQALVVEALHDHPQARLAVVQALERVEDA